MKSAVIAFLTTLVFVVFAACVGDPVPHWAATQLYFIVLIMHKLHERGER